MRSVHGIAALTFVAVSLLPPDVRPQKGPAAGNGPGAPSPTRATSSTTSSAASCRVEGVWELVSVTMNGQELPRPGYRERKIVTRGHFMWLGEDAGRDSIPLNTASDSLRAFRVAGGAGTYTLDGNKYTEHLEYFYDARMLGHSVEAACRTDGDRWYHSFTPVSTSNAASGQAQRLEQVWRRVS